MRHMTKDNMPSDYRDARTRLKGIHKWLSAGWPCVSVAVPVGFLEAGTVNLLRSPPLINKARKPIQSRQGLGANMRLRRTPNTDRGTSALRGGDGHGRDRGGRDHGHDGRGRCRVRDHDDRVLQQTQSLETA